MNLPKPLSLLLATAATALAVSSAAAAPNTDITIDNFAFGPADVTVAPGATLTWTNRQSAPHTATSDAGAFDSSILRNGETFQLTLDQPGDYAYHCEVHPDMHGVIHVVADQPPAAPAPADDASAAEAPAAQAEAAAPIQVAAPAPIAAAPVAAAPTPAPVPTLAPAPAAPTPAPAPAKAPAVNTTYGYGY